LRLVDVRFGAGRTVPQSDTSESAKSQFGGGLAGVLTEPADRAATAAWMASTVMGPAPVEAVGTDAAGERLVSVHGRPSLLVPPSAPAVLRRGDLRAHWQTVCARRRDDLAGAHASRRLERHRVEAALERTRMREVGPVNETVQLQSRVQTLLLAIDALVPVSSPEALALADAWDAHSELVRVRAAEPTVDIEAFEQRVNMARMSVAMTMGGVSDDARAEIDRRHRVVVQAEAELFDARRKARADAVARYEAAVAAEKLALADAGVDSYAAFLVALTGGGTPLGADSRRMAQQELSAATAALGAAHELAKVSTPDGMHARAVELRARAEQLLGRAVVGGDPPAELRALRVDAPGRAERVHQLTEALLAAGVGVQSDPVTTARELLPTAPSAERTQSGEVTGFERQLSQHERALAELEGEIARLYQIHDADISGIAPDDLALVMEALIEAYRAGNQLGGRLPLVLDGALDGLAPEARRAAAVVLAAATDVQSIVVSDDVQVMKSVTDAGGTLVLSPEAMAPSSAAPERGGVENPTDRWARP
jgi:hypothetical protein